MKAERTSLSCCMGIHFDTDTSALPEGNFVFYDVGKGNCKVAVVGHDHLLLLHAALQNFLPYPFQFFRLFLYCNLDASMPFHFVC